MKRFFKKLVYGVFYLAILAGIGFTVFPAISNPASEWLCESIPDCVSKCEDCDSNLIQGVSKVMPLNESSSAVLVEISNLNSKYGLNAFDYTIDVFSKFGPLLISVNGSSSIYPEERRYLIHSGLEVVSADVGKIELKLGALQWKPAADLVSRPLIEIMDRKVFDDVNSSNVEGTIINRSESETKRLILKAIGYFNGEIYRVGTTAIPDLKAGSSVDFRVFLPKFNYERVEVLPEFLP